MATDDKNTTPPVGAGPVSPAATPTTQGVTKPGQGAVPPTPITPAAAANPPAGAVPAGAAPEAALSPADPKATPPGDATATETQKPQPVKTALAETQPSVANKAPAGSTDNPFRVRRRALEEQLKSQENDKSRHAAHSRATTQAMLAELKDNEARHGHSGLSPLTPRGNLLQAGAIQAQFPADHLRWVNETIPGRAALLTSLGYERVPGSIVGGDTVLWKIPREKWASGEATKQAETDRMLRKATSRNRDETVHELQAFFDKHGVNVDVDRIVSRGD
jgi:hypothetical protein